jgi:D-arabinose 1-dehydrogenase-like Zn-dependent alcohol dehydrogenase
LSPWGYVDPTLEIPSYDIVLREKQVVGTRALTRIEFREIVELVNSGTSVPDIGELVPISQVNEASEKLRSGALSDASCAHAPLRLKRGT